MTLRNIPSVDGLLQNAAELIQAYGRPLVTQAIRESIEQVRVDVRAGASVPSNQQILALAESRLAAWTRSTLEPVINATGVIIHTNLGRAPLSQSAMEAMQAVSVGYSTLEFDLKTGKRGSRLVHAEAVLQRLTGAEAAVVVNNNAAAVLLTLSAVANRKRAIIARGQMIEIGGSVRIPDVMKQSGAKLVEVGSTNKVHLRDYEDALLEQNGILRNVVIRAHRSNFKIVGFTEEPSLNEICDLAHAHSAIVIDDLGSGTFFNVEKYGLTHEPTILESLAAGADVVTFSGDKLRGGPQAGIIVGRKALLDKIKKVFHDEFVTQNARLASNTQTAYSLSLAFGLLPDAMQKRAAQRLAEDVDSFKHITTGFLGASLVCPILGDYGYFKQALREVKENYALRLRDIEQYYK